MKEIDVMKEEQDGIVHFTFRFKALGQLLDEEVPDTIPGKELTEEAENALAGHLDEHRVSKPASIIIELPEQDLDTTSSTIITDAIRHHFGFRQKDLMHELKISMREGVYSVILMLVNISLFLLVAVYVTLHEIPIDSTWVIMVFAFLTIMNWATIWDTYEHFAYDHRNLARTRMIFQKITRIPIIVRGYRL